MRLGIEVWLRGNDHATDDVIDVPVADPEGWSDHDVRLVLEGLLRAIDRARHPEVEPDRPVTLRGFSWIVSPFENGVLMSVEIGLGAAAAGPFAIEQQHLERLITRAIAHARESEPPRVH